MSLYKKKDCGVPTVPTSVTNTDEYNEKKNPGEWLHWKPKDLSVYPENGI